MKLYTEWGSLVLILPNGYTWSGINIRKYIFYGENIKQLLTIMPELLKFAPLQLIVNDQLPMCRLSRRRHANAPMIAPIRQVERVPETIDLKPSEITSSRRSGAIVASPPIMIPRLPKLAKPHSA